MDEIPKSALRQEYITEIDNRLNKCNDIELLDFILQLLKKILLTELKE